jgi:hypothetical protein
MRVREDVFDYSKLRREKDGKAMLTGRAGTCDWGAVGGVVRWKTAAVERGEGR